LGTVGGQALGTEPESIFGAGQTACRNTCAADQLNNRVNEAPEEYLATPNQLMIVAAIAIVLGVLAG
jgi:hypothetical protein